MSILVTLKGTNNLDGRLEESGDPITIDDLDVFPSLDPIPQDWVQALIKAEYLAIDPDGCLRVLNRRRYIKYPSETKAAQRARDLKKSGNLSKQDTETTPKAAKQESPKPYATEPKSAIAKTSKKFCESTQNEIEESPYVHDMTIHDMTVHNMTSSSSPLPPPGGIDEEEDSGRYRSPGDLERCRADLGGEPPKPPPLASSSTTEVASLPEPTPEDVQKAISNAFRAVQPGPIRGLDLERFGQITAAIADIQANARSTLNALGYAVDLIKHQRNSGNEITTPRAYLVSCFASCLDRCSDRDKDRLASYRDGFKDPGPLIFRPKEAERC